MQEDTSFDRNCGVNKLLIYMKSNNDNFVAILFKMFLQFSVFLCHYSKTKNKNVEFLPCAIILTTENKY